MKGLNKVQVIGNLGKDVELRRTQSGDPVANFSMAVSEQWKDKDGEKRESTEWVRVVVWGKLAEIAEKYLRKGSRCYVEGKLKTSKWTDKDNIERFKTEVVVNGFGGALLLLDGSKVSADDRDVERDASQDYREASGSTGKGKRPEMDDEIPF